MTVKEKYEVAKEMYAKIGVDTDKAVDITEKHPRFPCTAGRGMT